MKLDISKYAKDTKSGWFKVIFTINDLDDEYHTVIPGPLVEVRGIPRHERINIPAVLEFCDTIINGIKNKSIKISCDIPTDCVRLNKAEYKIISADKEIGSIVFMYVYSCYASNRYNCEDALNAIYFSRYRAVYSIILEEWIIQYIDEDYLRSYRNIGSLPNTDNLNDIIDFMIKDMNRIVNSKGCL